MTLQITTDNISPATLQTLGGGVKITSLTYPNSATAANPAGSETITITGSGFNSGAVVYVDSTSCSTTYVSATSLTFTSPAKSAASYFLYVYNTDGSSGVKPAGILYSAIPVWVTSSGALTSAVLNVAYSQSVNATGDTIVYSLTSGSLPTGLSLNSSSGLISGTPTVANTYNFTITATDAQNQGVARSFSILSQSLSPVSTIEYLVVAGGGGGGGGFGGGGGAGGLLNATGVSITTAVTYTITVGAGGGGSTGTYSGGTAGSVGANSIISGSGFTTVTTIGGGGGGTWTGSNGTNGGSGGGASITLGKGTGVYPGSTYLSQARQGYDGGLGVNNGNPNARSGGGGGAGAVGALAVNGQSGAGGTGVQWPASSGTYYAGGGGAGSGTDNTGAGAGGSGGGGAGGNGLIGTAGTVNTGGGGGGGGNSVNGGANSGGSGIVFIRYPDTCIDASATTGSPTYTNTNGYITYQFTASGSITF